MLYGTEYHIVYERIGQSMSVPQMRILRGIRGVILEHKISNESIMCRLGRLSIYNMRRIDWNG